MNSASATPNRSARFSDTTRAGIAPRPLECYAPPHAQEAWPLCAIALAEGLFAQRSISCGHDGQRDPCRGPHHCRCADSVSRCQCRARRGASDGSRHRARQSRHGRGLSLLRQQRWRYGSRLAASDTVDDFPGLTVVYLRLAWAYLEPEEGHFNWAVVDTPAQRWIAKGKKVALRFTTSETGQMYATPEWVRKAGAEGTFTKNRQVVTAGGGRGAAHQHKR